jgi:hypothetical protein
MGEILRKFKPRAPRYVLRPNDAQLLFFAHQGQSPESKYPTKIVNVSETGIAFVVYKSTAPRIGDLIKIEFPVPGAEQIAWWARVVRLEEFNIGPWWRESNETSSQSEVLVAVNFEHLPVGHRREIQKGLWSRYQDLIREHRRRQRQAAVDFAKNHFWNLVLFALCAVAGILALYWISSLEPMFDVVKGSKWLEFWENLQK